LIDGPIHANFYRVVGVTEGGSRTTLELDPPLRTKTCTSILVMENVVEVFEKAQGWRP
jgi:hypothetical protein